MESKLCGRIDIILGPVFSGKSTALEYNVKRYRFALKKCLIVKYVEKIDDSREALSTDDGQTLESFKCQKLEEILPHSKKYDIIAIDEAHFFPNIVEICEQLANEGKTVLVAALDGTYERKPFGKVLELVCLAESITKLTAVCMLCYEDASFTKRATENKDIKLGGVSYIYGPMCRRCYMQRSIITIQPPEKNNGKNMNSLD